MEILFAKDQDLPMWAMAARGFIIFFTALVLIRLAGIRAFGIRTAFDNIIILMLGAILSNTVIGETAYLPTVAAALVIVLLHRLFAYWGTYSHAIGKIFKGRAVLLYGEGKPRAADMHHSLISSEDLHESVRLKGNVETLDQIEAAYLERNGEISVVKKTQ